MCLMFFWSKRKFQILKLSVGMRDVHIGCDAAMGLKKYVFCFALEFGFFFDENGPNFFFGFRNVGFLEKQFL